MHSCTDTGSLCPPSTIFHLFNLLISIFINLQATKQSHTISQLQMMILVVGTHAAQVINLRRFGFVLNQRWYNNSLGVEPVL